jgi:hypothetical protein
MLSGVTDPIFVLQRIGANGISYPFTLQARDQTEFTTAYFETGLFVFSTFSSKKKLYT